MSRRSGPGSPIKDMHQYETLQRVLSSADHEVMRHEPDAL
jgi:hypothetical protein